MLKQFLWVGLGGALGSMLRYSASLLIRQTGFPVATIIVNLLGSFLIGLIMGSVSKQNISSDWQIFLATGVCGGFTTFSAFSFESMQLLQEGKTGLTVIYILSSIAGSLIAVYAGYRIAV